MKNRTRKSDIDLLHIVIDSFAQPLLLSRDELHKEAILEIGRDAVIIVSPIFDNLRAG